MDYIDYQAGKNSEDFWFKTKNHLIEILLLKTIRKRNQKSKILNIGVGTGDDLGLLNKYGENYIIDTNKKALDLIDKSLYKEKKVADACELPFEEDFFDIVVAFDVFEHIKEDEKAILEIYRVLKKHGKLIFSVPAFQFLFSSHDKALKHQRRYNKKRLKTLLKKFKNLKLYYWNSTLFPLMAIIRLVKKNFKPKVEQPNSKIVNIIGYRILSLENQIIKYNLSLSPGLSIFGIGEKIN